MDLADSLASLRSVENVRLIDRFNNRQQIIGTIFLTSTHLIFVDPEGKRETWILHSLISTVDRLPITQLGSPLRIRTKHFFSADFIIPKERDCSDLHATLSQLKPDSYEKLYCFLYQAPNYLEKVWDPFLLATEYMRMGVPNLEWKVEDNNSNFEMCDTYPPLIYVPTSTTKSMLLGSSKFRSRGRLPILTYLHPNGASITRCSQPLSGFSARCLEDEQLLQCILKTNSQSNTMYIIDTRPRINAVANRAAGKGYENEVNYSNMQFKFCPIENIHIMRSSLNKVLDACELKDPSMNQYLNSLDNTSWLQHIKAVLEAAIFIARAIDVEKKNVLVHCSDGWDRTAQCCSLSSLLLSPYYRSIHGFRMLIEKEWFSFGHKFSDRCGHIRTSDNKEQSPVFLQFIEGVWQLTQLYPTAFEFNERFLMSLHDHSHSCQYGNFIGNCEKDRLDLGVKDRTYSYWNYVLQNVNDFRNPLFRPQSSYASEVLLPTIFPQTLKFWLNMYHRFDSGLLPKENTANTLTHLVDHTIALSDHARLLEKRIRELRFSLENGVTTPTSNEDINELQENQNPTSSIEHDSGSSENELNQTTAESNPPKSNQHLQLLNSLSDVESGISSDYSPKMKPFSPSFILPHQSSLEINDIPTIERIAFELNSIAVDWRTYHAPLHCACSSPFDSAQRKYNCWRCGENFCIRCIEHGIRLPGLYSTNFAPVCKTCVRSIKTSPLYIDITASAISNNRNKSNIND
ncbi:unnamed protein product [Rotaria magnacalcarata]|uniref:phosphatidylinositol-3,5-bisphosphate 3-phosphatase n=1 Tax=Rotaria magnacalcarata TaxID=392030 RepID=A0A819A9S5_9BILA|nr:unnamed protein product [Rotaria magnacalcarata]CAF3780234.1 unnamed protein product [Rotaria magnacalcarata]